MENLPIKETDVASFGGLALLIPLLVGTVKKLFKDWINGKESMVAVVLALLIGPVAKLTIPHAFGGVGWLTLFIGLILTAVGAMAVHDSLANKVLSNKGDSPPK